MHNLAMSSIKTIAVGSVLALCLFYDAEGIVNTYTSDFSNIRPFTIEEAKEIASKNHDWECKYIIQDGYHEEKCFHFVNEITVNCNGSITFVDETKKSWTIPAPYFWIHKNPKFN